MKEICGKCVPCRDGIPNIRKIIKELASGNASDVQVLELEALVNNLRSSRCTIGLSVGKNLEVVLKNNFDLLTSRINKEGK
jgi:NADH:ubiquinone oxidoreductase subunit F (NADH-binding)